MEVTLDEHGRISLPQSLQEKLGLEEGEQLSVEIEGEALLLKPVSERSVLKERDGILVSTAEVDPEIDVETVIDAVRGERSKNIADLSNE